VRSSGARHHHAINAVITGRTARTGLLVTAGHPDILVLREGGRAEPFNFRVPYPAPYVLRHLTFEIVERMNSVGEVVTPLDEAQAIRQIHALRDEGVEAVAVCLLWSIANPEHELRLGERWPMRICRACPTRLSHRLNPTLREYRRASSAAIDASLKPLMRRYLGTLRRGWPRRASGGRSRADLTGRGWTRRRHRRPADPCDQLRPLDGAHRRSPLRRPRPISTTRSSPIPAARPTTSASCGRPHPQDARDLDRQPYRGHMTGFPSIDIKSVGAGGGSIAGSTAAGCCMSARAAPARCRGPVCYGEGGDGADADRCLPRARLCRPRLLSRRHQ
jgi:N-methylhydantoinase A